MVSDLNRLKETFQRMEDDEFNTNLPLNWGYFFFDNDKVKLEKLYNELSSDYELISLEKVDSLEWKLYLQRIELLSPEGLHNRNKTFNELAEKYNVALYDGWDVEKLS